MGHSYETGYMAVIHSKERKWLLEFAEKASPGVRIAVHILDKQGMRPGEGITVNINKIDFPGQTLLFWSPKQKKWITRTLNPKLVPILKDHCERYKKEIAKVEGYVCFPTGRSKNLHIQYGTLAWFFRNFRLEYGLTAPYNIRRNGNPLYRIKAHVNRARFATDFYLASGCNLKLLMDEMGWKDYSTAMRYIRFSNVKEMSLNALGKMN